MEILPPAVRRATLEKFEAGLAGSADIHFFFRKQGRRILPGSAAGEESRFGGETRRLLEEVSSLSGRIGFFPHDFDLERALAESSGIDMAPAIVLKGRGDPGIRFFGAPSGYEYASLIEALIDVSRWATSLTETTKEALKTVASPLHIQVFVTPACPHCSRAVRLGHQFALESPFIISDMVESTEFASLADLFGVRGVPKTVINGTFAFEGAVPEAVFLENVLRALPAKTGPEFASL